MQAAFAQQNTTAVSIGAELNIPQRSRYNLGYGVSGKFELPVIAPLSLSVTAGYNRLHYKSVFRGAIGAVKYDDYVPLKAGVKFYNDSKFYFEGELGSILVQAENRSNLFAYSLGAGFLLPANNRKTAFDIGLRYENWSKSNLREVVIRAAYRFGGRIGGQ